MKPSLWGSSVGSLQAPAKAIHLSRVNRRITRVSVHQTSKVMSLLYLYLGVLLFPLGLAICMLAPEIRDTGVALLVAPIIYPVVGYASTAVCAALYNFVAARAGGVEFESVEKPRTA